jgi:acyl carrier protein
MPTPDLVLQRLRLLADSSLDLNLTAPELATLNRLDELAGFDSMSVLQFLAAVEREFGITFEETQLRAAFLVDLPALAAYIAAHRGAAC